MEGGCWRKEVAVVMCVCCVKVRVYIEGQVGAHGDTPSNDSCCC